MLKHSSYKILCNILIGNHISVAFSNQFMICFHLVRQAQHSILILVTFIKLYRWIPQNLFLFFFSLELSLTWHNLFWNHRLISPSNVSMTMYKNYVLHFFNKYSFFTSGWYYLILVWFHFISCKYKLNILCKWQPSHIIQDSPIF